MQTLYLQNCQLISQMEKFLNMGANEEVLQINRMFTDLCLKMVVF